MSKHKIQPVDQQVDFPSLERDLIEHWYNSGIVDKYLHKNDNSDKKFYFQDGPITANNPMGVHHAWGRTYKDLWQRYKNLKGFKQRFQNGFDCQGLWVEVEVEKELGFRSKKDIENYGVDKFVQLCKDRVKKYSEIQTQQSKRLGYFMDWDNSYFTMSPENNYMIWHFLKVCHKKDFIYIGHDSVPWCPRCETAISQHEMLTEDYKEITHKSVYFKLPIIDRDKEYLLVWTTTPWTIPANIAVAVDATQEYSLVEDVSGDKYWLHKELVEKVFKNEQKQIIKTVLGKDLVGQKYTAPFDFLEAVQNLKQNNLDKFHTVIATDPLIMPITATDGTGLVHTAVSAGTEDFKLGKKLGLPMLPIIEDNADYLPGLDFLSGKNAKKHPEVILDYLGDKWAFRIENITHRYPACWRCKTELVWKVADEWYINMDKKDPDDKQGRTLRQKMIDVAKKINWKPEFGLDRELDWLNNMHDWLISKKNRYWGLALPIWVCDDCGKFEVLGGREELKERSTEGWDKFEGHTPHKPFVDEVKIKCVCGHNMTRVSDVGNPWLDAGIVPYSTLVDPQTKEVSYTTDKKYWQNWFPADFITESFPGQFKNWFYAMIAMSTVLEDTNPFSNVLGFASMLGEDGRAMHKSWGNSIEFNEGADKIGVDVMRWSFVRHNPERNLLFGYKLTSEIKRQFHMILWNSYRFFVNNVSLEDNWQYDPSFQSTHVLDKWILARLSQVVETVDESLSQFNAFSATESVEEFVSDFSTWFIRRSRDRVGPTAPDSGDKNACYQTFYQVLEKLSRVLSVFVPFISDLIYTNITGNESVHLVNWPTSNKLTDADLKLVENMKLVRNIVEKGHAERKNKGVAVKQTLASISLSGEHQAELSHELQNLIKDELNVEAIIFADQDSDTVIYDLNLTESLINKGKAREIIRKIQEARKVAGCDLTEKIDLVLPEWPNSEIEAIKNKALIRNLEEGESLQVIRINAKK